MVNSSDGRRLSARWAALTGDRPGADEVLADLLSRLAEPHRAYHDAAHVRQVLEVLRAHDVPGRPEVELAAFFHDAVYDPRRPDNEEASARLAVAQLERLGFEGRSVARVRDLILATRDHAPTQDEGLRWLLDADLSVLGAPPEAYDRYARDVRREYAHVPPEAWREGRGRVLRGLLGRERLFQTPELRARLEMQARENISRELRQLEAGEGA